MAVNDASYVFPQEHQTFLDDFQGLLKKHPRAAERFRLADVGDGAGADVPLALGGPTTVWECRRTEWGLECHRVHPPLM